MSVNKTRNQAQEPREPRLSWLELSGLLQRPIAFHRIFATIAGGAMPGLFLSQAYYWTGTLKEDSGGWFYKSLKEWHAETGLTRYEQETARKKLIARGLLETDNRGVPATLHFRLIREALLLAIEDALNSQFAENQQTEFVENQQTSSSKTNKLVRGKSTNKRAGNPQTYSTENKQKEKRDVQKATGDLKSSSKSTAGAMPGQITKRMESAALAAFNELLDAREQQFIKEQARLSEQSLPEVMRRLKDYEVGIMMRRQK